MIKPNDLFFRDEYPDTASPLSDQVANIPPGFGSFRPSTLSPIQQEVINQMQQFADRAKEVYGNEPSTSAEQEEAIMTALGQAHQASKLNAAQKVLAGFARGQMESPYAGNRVIGASIAGAIGAQQGEVQQQLSISNQMMQLLRDRIDLRRQRIAERLQPIQIQMQAQKEKAIIENQAQDNARADYMATNTAQMQEWNRQKDAQNLEIRSQLANARVENDRLKIENEQAKTEIALRRAELEAARSAQSIEVGKARVKKMEYDTGKPYYKPETSTKQKEKRNGSGVKF